MVREKITAKRKSGKEPRTVSLSVIIVVLIVGIVALVGFLTFFSIGPPLPSKPGYCEFRLVDTETGEELTGDILLVKYDETDKKYSNADYDNPIETGKTIFLSEPCLATIYSVSLKTDPTRIWLPFTISPITSDNPDEPAINTIWVYFLLDPNDVNVSITEKDGVPGHYNETDLIGDVEYDIELTFDITLRNAYSVYGANSYVPDYILPTINKNYDVNGFGLWLMFNGTDIIKDSVIVNEIPSDAFYISEWNASIILLHPETDVGGTQDVTFELKKDPTTIGIFQGFLDDLAETYIQIT